ncbi:His/Gly/Thr/Pro-type tRNA ligase C-terminal domain-containing protein [Staphylococcus pseudoxylosus]|nr:His/Gly/Thr/Pro-type tRNA ligase C-terminal domain-containing protein [Staphylococcus pseudoxylosus]MEB6036655.1 His/Gly/Thr/Pro-type tRNA ligase C-terminal domain-containing protein [Staphylococcus pseudoxylosus]
MFVGNVKVKKVVYTIVIGDDEVSKNTLSVRKHGGNSEQTLELSNFIEK